MSTVIAGIVIVMPSLTDGMESGTIIAWLVEDGAVVARGEELLEVETDKATATVASEHAGVLHILMPVGGTAAVGETIARIGDDMAPAPATTPASAPTPSAAKADEPAAEPAAVPAVEPAAVPAVEPAATPVAEPAAAPVADLAPPRPEGGSVRASPVARRMARLHAVDLATLKGSGPGGRVLRADVERAAALEPAAPVPALAAAQDNGTAAAPPTKDASPATAQPRASAARGAVTRVDLSRLQQVVARRMVEAKAAVPDFVIGVDVDMEEAVALRTQLKALATDGKPPSYNDFVVKASALALREYPRANGAYVDGSFQLFEYINVGIAVAAEDALVVPTIFHADRKSLGEIGRESRRLAAAVRDGNASLAELSGGTFTVSNLGMFGISEFTSIVNPPQAAILSVGEMRRTPVEHESELALRQIMKLRLTCDHRILYGADAAGFLRRVKELLQAPLAMSL